MSIQAVSDASLFQEIQSFYQNRRTDVKQLGNALQSGDLAAAQQAYDALVSLGQGGPFSNADPFNKAGREAAFEAIGQALQAGDLSGAQSAYAALKSGGYPVSQDQTSPAAIVNVSTPQTQQTQGSESIYQQLQEFRTDRKADLKQLADALQSGDLNAAQQAYATLVQLGQDGPFKNSEPFGRTDRAQDFDAIGTALQAGDLAGAQQAFQTLSGTYGHGLNGSDGTGTVQNASAVSADGPSTVVDPIQQHLPVSTISRNGSSALPSEPHGGPMPPVREHFGTTSSRHHTHMPPLAMPPIQASSGQLGNYQIAMDLFGSVSNSDSGQNGFSQQA